MAQATVPSACVHSWAVPWGSPILALPGWADGGSRDAYSFGHGLAEMLHPVCHLSLAVGTQLQAGPVGQNDLEGVGPVCGVGSPAATALLPPGPE